MHRGAIRDDVGGGVHAGRSAHDRLDRLSPLAAMFDGTDHLADARLNFGPPPRSIENTVVADTRLDVVILLVLRDIDTQIMCGLCLVKSL